VNLNEAKSVFQRYRHGTADVEDPQIAAALKLAKTTPELTDWLVAHCACQFALSQQFRRITAPAGLKEQIISEQAASQRRIATPWPAVRLALAAVIVLGGLLAIVCFPRRAAEDTLAIYQQQMAGRALRGYAMDFSTHDLASAREFFRREHAPADFMLPASLQQATPVGCAVENWQGTKVALLCFRTGKPLAPGATSDLWLFVADRMAVKQVPAGPRPTFAKINRLITATWIQGEKLYLLGAVDNDSARKYLAAGKS